MYASKLSQHDIAFWHSIFAFSATAVAPKLIGHYLVHETENGLLGGRIIETEAYTNNDPPSHAYKGLTRRNQAMFGPAGRAYIYLIYGKFFCMNCTTGPEGTGEGVLIRALEPVQGLAIMRHNRNKTAYNELCSGPGKLTQAMQITLFDYGTNLIDNTSHLRLMPCRNQEGDLHLISSDRIGTSPRIGLSKGKAKLRRFFLKDSHLLSISPKLQGP